MSFVAFTDVSELKLVFRGKVRDVYETSEDEWLMIATDRISAFDVILPTPIPDKGKILTQISSFWFKKIEKELGISTHFVSDSAPECPKFEGRTMKVKKAEPMPVECIVRFNLLGSAWREYKESGTIHGVKYVSGLKYGDELPEPLFTPSTKAEKGVHDENIDFERMVQIVGEKLAEKMREESIKISKFARDFLMGKGIILLDTKFEFGLCDGKLTLIDEVFTPDSSRFWIKGEGEEFYDKEFLRQYLLKIRWDKTPPAPWLSEDFVEELKRRYKKVLEITLS